MLKQKHFIHLILLAFLLSGCRSITAKQNIVRNTDNDYLNSKRVAAIKVPTDLPPPRYMDEYPIPGEQVSTSPAKPASLLPPPKLSTKGLQKAEKKMAAVEAEKAARQRQLAEKKKQKIIEKRNKLRQAKKAKANNRFKHQQAKFTKQTRQQRYRAQRIAQRKEQRDLKRAHNKPRGRGLASQRAPQDSKFFERRAKRLAENKRRNDITAYKQAKISKKSKQAFVQKRAERFARNREKSDFHRSKWQKNTPKKPVVQKKKIKNDQATHSKQLRRVTRKQSAKLSSQQLAKKVTQSAHRKAIPTDTQGRSILTLNSDSKSSWTAVGNALKKSNYRIISSNRRNKVYYMLDTKSTGGIIKQTTPVYKVHLSTKGKETKIWLTSDKTETTASNVEKILSDIKSKL